MDRGPRGQQALPLRIQLMAVMLIVSALSVGLGASAVAWPVPHAVWSLVGLVGVLAIAWFWLERHIVAPLGDDVRLRAHIEEDLRRKAAEVEDLYNHAPCGYHSLDAAGKVVRINDTALAWLGYLRDEVVGQPFHHLLCPEGKALFAATFPEFKERGVVRDIEFPMRRKDGSILHVLLSSVAIRGPSGEYVQSRSTFIDITQRKQSENRLAEISARLHAVLNAATAVAIIAFDSEGRITLFNTGAERMLGWRSDAILGRDVLSTIHLPAEIQARCGTTTRPLDLLIGKAREGGHEEGEWTYVRQDGSRLLVHLVVTAVRNTLGELVGYLGIASDVTERIRARERLELTMSAARIGYWDRDVITNRTTWSPNVQAMFGVAGNASASLDGFLSLVLETDRERVRQEIRAVLEDPRRGDAYHAEFRVRGEGGTIRWLEERGRVFRDPEGRPVHLMGTVMDVTERHAAAERLRQARDEAEAASKAKGEFLASMSHEIRTPLNGIIGMVELLSQTPVNEEQRGYLETLGKATESLLSLVDAILDISKIEAGKLELEQVPFDPATLVRDAVRVLDLPARRKGLTLTYHAEGSLPRSVLGDPGRLRQVLLNLIGNAVKFTASGAVTVRVQRSEEGFSPAQPHSAQLRFSVADTGIGIPSEKLQRIFEPFAQASSATARTHGGTGLGLTISARLVECMGSSLTVFSEPGRGSTFAFTLTLPIAEEGVVVKSAQATQPAAETTVDVLVVEDNAVNQQVLTLLLEKVGHRVTVAGNGREALELLEQRRFDLVLMDLQMPEMDGLRAAKLIRQREKALGRRVPIVAVTANALQGERQRCLAAGMDDYLSKPVRAAELFALIGRLVGRPIAGEEAGRRSEVGQPGWLASLQAMGFDREAILRLAHTFVDTVPSRLTTLRQAVAAGDGQVIQETAHTLKGSLAVFSVRPALDTAVRLEMLGRQGRLDEAEEALTLLTRQMDPLLASMAEVLEKWT